MTAKAYFENAKDERELCAKCRFTFYNHIGNTGMIYPCWTPSGRYSTDKNTNDVPVSSEAVISPLRTVGKEIAEALNRGEDPTGQSALRKRRTTEDPPEIHIASNEEVRIVQPSATDNPPSSLETHEADITELMKLDKRTMAVRYDYTQRLYFEAVKERARLRSEIALLEIAGEKMEKYSGGDWQAAKRVALRESLKESSNV